MASSKQLIPFLSNIQSSSRQVKKENLYLHRMLSNNDCTENYQIKSFDVGHLHTCALNTNNELNCWGLNEQGQLGLEKDDNSILFGDNLAQVDIGNELKVKSVHLGSLHSCVLLESGDVKCFGYNGYGQLGYGDTINIGYNTGSMGDNLALVDIGQGLKVKQVQTRYFRNCVIFQDDRMKCWGSNYYHELGYGDKNDRGDESGEMGDYLPFVGDTLEVLDVALGFYHTCILSKDNEVKCFGDNEYGQLGYGDTLDRAYSNDLPTVDVGGSVKIIKCTSYSTCIVLHDNSIKCWGNNDYGQIGQGDKQDKISPVLVDIGSNESVEDIVAGTYHFCAILADKTVKCWGDNYFCQLGLGIDSSSNKGDEPDEMGNYLPSLDFGSRAVKEVKSAHSTCVKFMNDEFVCFGDNSRGQLTFGDKNNRGCNAQDMGNNLEMINICNTKTPSISPSTLPSWNSEESSIEPDSWYISYLNYTSENMLSSFELEYEISKGKQQTQFISSIYNSDCEIKTDTSIISVLNATIHEQDNQIYDKGLVSVTIDSSVIKDSTYWNNISIYEASIDFCVKSELLYSEDSQLSISFSETTIQVGVDLTADFTSFQIRDISVQKIEATSVEDKANLKVSACICDKDQICKVSPTLNQNIKFFVCVMPLDPNVKVKKFQSVSLIQDGEAKLMPIVDGINQYIGITSIIEDVFVGIVETRLTSTFFETSNPSDLLITGEVLLDFSGNRRLEEGSMINNNGEAEFSLSVNLIHTSNGQEHPNIFSMLVLLLAFSTGFFFAKKPVEKVKYTELVQELD